MVLHHFPAPQNNFTIIVEWVTWGKGFTGIIPIVRKCGLFLVLEKDPLIWWRMGTTATIVRIFHIVRRRSVDMMENGPTHCQRPSYRLGPQSTADGFDVYDKNNSIMVIYIIWYMISGLPCMDFPHCGHQLGPRWQKMEHCQRDLLCQDHDWIRLEILSGDKKTLKGDSGFLRNLVEATIPAWVPN